MINRTRQTLQYGEPNTYEENGVGEPGRLERLWAPFRSAYIINKDNRSTEPFVDAPKRSDEDALIVARGDLVYCLLNLFPYNSGHMLVVPYRKVGQLEELTAAESAEMMAFAQHAIRALKKVSNPHGINVGFNLGNGSGGSVRDHLHMHIVPRWSGDANFITVIDETKVLPQLLRDTRHLLAEAWEES